MIRDICLKLREIRKVCGTCIYWGKYRNGKDKKRLCHRKSNYNQLVGYHPVYTKEKDSCWNWK